GRAMLKGDDERDLMRALAVIESQSGVGVKAGELHVAYRATLSESVAIIHTYMKQAVAEGEFAKVVFEFEPLPLGSGFRFENAVEDGCVPDEFIPAIEQAIRAEQELGLGGIPLMDVLMRLTGGAYREMDSSPAAFEAAVTEALRKARAQGI